MTVDRWSRTLAAVLVAAAVGCKNCELVEAQLRHQNRRVEELEAELASAKHECQMLKNTVEHLSARPLSSPPGGPSGTSDENASTDRPGGASPISLARRSAAGCKLNIGALSREKDFDGDGRSDGLTLNFSLVDQDGDLAKIPGAAVVEVFELLTNGRPRQIGVWEFDESQLRRLWRSGVFGSGYQVTFGWQRAPSSESLRAVVHYRTTDGDEFEASKDLRVMLSPRIQWREAGPVADDSAARPDWR